MEKESDFCNAIISFRSLCVTDFVDYEVGSRGASWAAVGSAQIKMQEI